MNTPDAFILTLSERSGVCGKATGSTMVRKLHTKAPSSEDRYLAIRCHEPKASRQ